MTETLTLGVDTDRDSVIGDRQLVAVQTFFVSRLTSHPVVLVPGTFIAVTGRGPRGDSNGSGKTSFLAAVSLLLGDREWRLAGGAKAPTALLFDARAAGGAVGTTASASHGYIVGLFTRPSRPYDDARTVWLRIDTAPPYVTVRWTDGNALVVASSDREAHDVAGATWQALPRSDHGFDSYARVLYGDAPRCLAYVQQRGATPNKPSLLQMNAGAFTSAQIGESLIRLTGQRHLLDTELEQRRLLANQVHRRDEMATHHDRTFREEELQLESVRRRDRARAHLADAADAWHRHFAAGLLETLERVADLDAAIAEAQARHAELDADLAEAAAALEELRSHTNLEQRVADAERAYERKNSYLEDARVRQQRRVDKRTALTHELSALRTIASGAPSRDPDAAQVEFDRTCEERDRIIGTAGAARERANEAEQHLRATEAGGAGLAGATLAALRHAGIDAVVLLDSTTINDDRRSFWEPILSRWGDAVVLPPQGDVNDALAAAADLPGAVLVATDHRGALPDGITSCPPGALGLLRHLAAQFTEAAVPPSVHELHHGVHVIGDFTTPIVGRDARRAQARADFEYALQQLNEAEQALELAKREVEDANQELARSRAVARILEIQREIPMLDDEIQRESETLRPLADDAKALHKAWVEVAAEHQNHEQLITAAEAGVELRRSACDAAARDLGGLERERATLPLDYWSNGWGTSVDDARALLDNDDRRAVTFRRIATEALNRAAWELGATSPDAAPTEQIAAALRSRDARRDEDENTQAATFQETSAAIGDHLDGWSDSDRIIEATISDDREHRATERKALEAAVGEAGEGLERIQDATATLLEGSLHQIGNQLDEIRRAAGLYGAKLEVEAVRPDRPDALWEWKVTPLWQRVHGGPFTRYDTRSNTAQEKLFTVHLVLAALLAAPDPRGRVLILDELGDSLGDEHRRHVLEAIRTTAERTGITVLGTCQDSVLSDAATHCGEILYFEHVADTEALNRPTRMFGFDQGDRVELTREALVASRPPV